MQFIIKQQQKTRSKKPPVDFVVKVDQRKYRPWPLYTVLHDGKEIGRYLSVPDLQMCEDALKSGRVAPRPVAAIRWSRSKGGK